ncbi:hypothetical protein M8J77_013143 [Diaphorina citri]|nr:hypothetical protein M8J77_013143 [Diaphorina citri]
MTSYSKRSCPIRQLSLQQDSHSAHGKPKRPLQKQKSHDATSNHLALQINNTKFSRSQTPDARPRPRNVIHQPKPKPIKLAWTDKKSLSTSSGVEEDEGDGKVQVIAKKCKEIPRPFTAKPKVEVETKSTLLYSKEELADRLKTAIKERQSRKQNLDIFLAHNVNNSSSGRPKSMIRPGLDDPRVDSNPEDCFHGDREENGRSDGQTVTVHGNTAQDSRVERHPSSVLDFDLRPTNFVPYEDIGRGRGHGSGLASSSRPNGMDPGGPNENVDQGGSTSSSATNICDSCVQNCAPPQQAAPSSVSEEPSSFLMSSAPCLHRTTNHQPSDVLKFKEIFNIEKQRPFSVRVIDDKIDIFNDDEDNDSLLLIDSDDNEDGESLTSSVDNDEPTEVPSQIAIESVKDSVETKDVRDTPTKPEKLPASVRRSMFRNSSGRQKANYINQTIKGVDGLTTRRSRLTRMSSAPSTHVTKAALRRQTTVSSQDTGGGKARNDVKRDDPRVLKDMMIPTISITEDDNFPEHHRVETPTNSPLLGEAQNNTLANKENKYADRSKLVLRKQNSMIHFSSDLDIGKPLHNEYQPLNDKNDRRDRDIEKSLTMERSPSSVIQKGNETDMPTNDENISEGNTFPHLGSKFTIQRQNSKPNKISFQSTLSNYMKNETMIKPILTNSNYDMDRPDRVKSALTLANKKKLKFSKKKFHKSLDDLSFDPGSSDSKKQNKIPNSRDVVTMVSLLSDESDVECDTPEPCPMVVHHPPTLAIMTQAQPEEGHGKHSLAPPVSTFQVCLRKPADKPVTLPVQTSASGRSYSTLYPSRRGPGFDAPSASNNSAFPVQNSRSPQVSAAFKRKQTRVKSASLCSSSKSIPDSENTSNPTQPSNEMPSESTLPSNPVSQDVKPDLYDMPNNLVITLPITSETSDSETPEQLDKNETDRKEIEGTREDLDTNGSRMRDNSGSEMDLDRPPIFRTSKEQDCWTMFQKMTKKGINVSYDTILRGMLTPTEYRLHKKCNAAALERSDSLGDNIAVN